MTADALGYYQILNSRPDTDEKTLKINYRDSAKMWHPDHNKADNALEQFQKISLAYNILSDPRTRLVYDMLCLVYGTTDFPDMKTLKIYKSATGDETPFLRVFKLYGTYGLKNKKNFEEQNLVGTFEDARKFIKHITTQNWLKGWWHRGGIKNTVAALKKNYRNINRNYQDNFKMLVHNAAAFYFENKTDKAYLSLLQAAEYLPPDKQMSFENSLAKIQPVSAEIPQWDYRSLRKVQLMIPKILAAGAFILALGLVWPYLPKYTPVDDKDKIAYYQEVRFNNGTETVDDVVVAQVFNIPPDPTDTHMLYYLTDTVNIMYGPSEEFDVMAKGRLRQTVRVTGYTPDRSWYRIMLDNGETGFVKREYLKRGIGKEIPARSKIFYNPNL